MNERTAVFWLLCACLLAACGPSKAELSLRDRVKGLQHDLQEQQQYNADLKVRMQLARARNNVLVDLVHGLTSDPDHPVAGQDANAALGAAHTSLQALDRDLEALVTSVQHSVQDMEAVRAQRKALQEQLAQARHTMEDDRAAEAKVQARSEAFRAMLVQLTSMIEHGDLDVRVVRNRMVLQLPESVLFRSNDARVIPGGKALLDRVAAVLKSVERREFEIAGHTDGLPIRYGPYHSNWELSAARALGVMLYLQKRGVPAARLSATAHADTQPIADEATPAGRQKNRRIEIVLLPNLEELPDLSMIQTSVATQIPAGAAAAPGSQSSAPAQPATGTPKSSGQPAASGKVPTTVKAAPPVQAATPGGAPAQGG
jgi:chemotaxis protein MotB